MLRKNSILVKNIMRVVSVRYCILVTFVCGILQPVLLQGQVFRGYYSDGAVQFKSKKDRKKQVIRGYYPTGALEFMAYYKDGELDGVVREYYENGILKAEIPYKESRRHGLAKFYYANGMLMGKIVYKRGHETGEAKFYDEDGILTSSTPRLKRRLRRSKRYEVADSVSTDKINREMKP